MNGEQTHAEVLTERSRQKNLARDYIMQGVHIVDPTRFDQRGTIHFGSNVKIDIGVIFEGNCEIGDNVTIGPYCVIRDTWIGDGTVVEAYSHLVGAVIGGNAKIGPFARLRPGADLADEVHIGNFVEVKNSSLGKGSKANHLAYIGDAKVGERVNYGAGSITANYDGAFKHESVIGNDVHVGSNCVLIAPVTIADGATIAAGSAVAKEVKEGLTIVRAWPMNRPEWKRPTKASPAPNPKHEAAPEVLGLSQEAADAAMQDFLNIIPGNER